MQKHLWKKWLKDEVFREKVGKAPNKEERMKVVKEAGFHFDLEHFQVVKAELSDEELELASGGDKGGGLWHVDQPCGPARHETCTPGSEGQCGCGDSA